MFTFDGEASLSWYVTASEREALVQRAASDWTTFEELERWWNTRRDETPAHARGLRLLDASDRFRPRS